METQPNGNYIFERYKLKTKWMDLIASYTELKTKLDIGRSSEESMQTDLQEDKMMKKCERDMVQREKKSNTV